MRHDDGRGWISRAVPMACVGVVVATAIVVGGSAAGAVVPGANGKIVFASDRDGDQEIFIMDPDGSNQTQLTNVDGSDRDPVLSPDATRIAFSSARDGDVTRHVYVMNVDGTGQTRLRDDGPLAGGRNPAWSPDGTKIAFERNEDIYVMNAADGSGLVRLTDNHDYDVAPSWSPDGTKIAFTSSRDGNQEIYVMDAADGGDLVRITDAPGFDASAAWSPDGTKIAFEAWREGSSAREIYVINADGSGETRLTFGGAVEPTWSPDGTKIVYVDFWDSHNIAVMNADGSGQAAITNGDAGTFGDFNPDWGVDPSAPPPPPDRDGDGVPDAEDAFPDDPSEWADTDSDGLGDNRDPDTVADAVATLPPTAFAAPGHRTAIEARLEDAEGLIVAGDTDSARAILTNLRRRLDGCESGPTADANDWIVDCDSQDDIRALLDTLLESLTSSASS